MSYEHICVWCLPPCCVLFELLVSACVYKIRICKHIPLWTYTHGITELKNSVLIPESQCTVKIYSQKSLNQHVGKVHKRGIIRAVNCENELPLHVGEADKHSIIRPVKLNSPTLNNKRTSCGSHKIRTSKCNNNYSNPCICHCPQRNHENNVHKQYFT